MKMKAVSANRHALFLLNAALALISAPGTWALNAAKQTGAANEVNCMLTAGYWGQNSVGLRLPREQWEMPIGDYCDNGDWDILMMSFLHIFKDGTPPKPGLNFAYHCEDAPDPNYPRLLVCQNFTAGIEKCQRNGKKVFLSLGGAVSQALLTSEQDGADYATVLWNMFLGGNDPSYVRPFGKAILDGVDLNIEGGQPTGYAGLVNALRGFYDADPSKIFYIAGAPQCPFPDSYLGPTGAAPVYALGSSWFDFVFIQFYNNFCGIQNFDNPNAWNFGQWNTWAAESKTLLLMGVPGASYAAGSGYRPATEVLQIAEKVAGEYGPGKGWFSGIMMWDVGSATMNVEGGQSFIGTISAAVKQWSQCAAPPTVPPLPPVVSETAVPPVTGVPPVVSETAVPPVTGVPPVVSETAVPPVTGVPPVVSETALPPVTGVPPVTDLPPMTDAPPMTMTSATEMQPSPTVSSTEAPASPTATDSQGPTMPTHPVAPGCPQEMDPCNPQTVQGSCSGTYLAWCTSKKHWRLQACADGLICKMWTGAPRCDYPSIVDPPVTCKGLPGASKAKVAPTATMVSEEEAEDDEDDKVTVNKNKSSADAATICMCPEDSGFPATAVKETAVLPCEAPKSGLRARRCYHNKGDNSCSWGVIRPHCL